MNILIAHPNGKMEPSDAHLVRGNSSSSCAVCTIIGDTAHRRKCACCAFCAPGMIEHEIGRNVRNLPVSVAMVQDHTARVSCSLSLALSRKQYSDEMHVLLLHSVRLFLRVTQHERDFVRCLLALSNDAPAPARLLMLMISEFPPQISYS